MILFIKNCENTCFACPTIYEFDDYFTNEHYYFRLRNGEWRFTNKTLSKVLERGFISDKSGCCSFTEMKDLLKRRGIHLEENIG